MENNQQELTGTTFVLLNNNQELLLQLRDSNTENYPNTWCFPGESREGDEDAIQTAIRGVKEECGFQISKESCSFLTINHLPHISQNVGIVFCEVNEVAVPKITEGRDMRWMKLEDVKKLKLGYEHNKMIPLIEEKVRNI